MKLKYLLPAATIASVAAVVTPLVTSCGSKTTATYTHGTPYKPMTPKEATKYEDDDALTVAYHDDVKKNKFIFADDMVNTLASLDGEEGYDIRKVSYKVTNVGDVETLPLNKKAWHKYFRISLDVQLDAQIDAGVISLDFQNRKAVIKDLPIRFSFMKVDNVVTVNEAMMFMEISSPEIDLREDTKWSAELPEINSSGEMTKNQKTYNKTTLAKGEDKERSTVEALLTAIARVYPSNYYKNVTQEEA